MSIGQAFLPVTATEETPGPTQCILIVSGHATIVEKAEKEAFIKKAVDEGRVVADPNCMTLEFKMT